ncbi:hypothetical protein [Mariniluteicoccus flavus]
MGNETTLLRPHWELDLADEAGEDDEPGERHAWVLAAPFRAHVQNLMMTEALPWRVIAGLAGVQDAVVRTLVCGRGGRLRPRLAPRDAAALMATDTARVRKDRCLVVPARETAYACRTLLLTGRTVPEVAEMLDLTSLRTRAILAGHQRSTTLLVQHRSRAALRAHGFPTPDDVIVDPAIVTSLAA